MRKTLTFACVSIAVVVIYLGSVFYSRWRNNQELIRNLKAPAEARNQAFIKAYGGGIKIAAFYAVPSAIRPGETAQLCYSVIDAESVQIEPPPVEDVWPSRSRCVKVQPGIDATYRLIAKDTNGNERAANLVIRVH